MREMNLLLRPFGESDVPVSGLEAIFDCDIYVFGVSGAGRDGGPFPRDVTAVCFMGFFS